MRYQKEAYVQMLFLEVVEDQKKMAGNAQDRSFYEYTICNNNKSIKYSSTKFGYMYSHWLVKFTTEIQPQPKLLPNQYKN